MAVDPRQTKKRYIEKEQKMFDVRWNRIRTAAQTIERMIDEILSVAGGQEYADYYEVELEIKGSKIRVDLASEQLDLERLIDMNYKVVGWECVKQTVYVDKPNKEVYTLQYKIYKPVEPWRPHPSMDMNSLMRFGPTRETGERYQPLNLPSIPLTAEQQQAHAELSGFVQTLAKNARARNGNSEK